MAVALREDRVAGLRQRRLERPIARAAQADVPVGYERDVEAEERAWKSREFATSVVVTTG